MRRRSPALSGALLLVAALLSSSFAAHAAHADVTTVSGDLRRSGWDSAEPSLSPDRVHSAGFGIRFDHALSGRAGQVYAEPLVIGNRVLVATEENQVYALDRTTGAELWHRDLAAAGETPFDPTAAPIGCGDLSPHVGITGTPVVDPSTGTAYFVAKSWNGSTQSSTVQKMHAVDVTTGGERAGWPVTIAGRSDNVPTDANRPTFPPAIELQRPGLLLMNGAVYAAFGGHCDYGTYRGWVAGVKTSTHAISAMWTAESNPADDSATPGAGIWQSGAGLVADTGRADMWLVTGNGNTPMARPAGSTLAFDKLGQTVSRLHVGSDGHLVATDYFAPYDASQLSGNDVDFGSSGVTQLPGPTFGTTAHPNLLVVGGKEGRVYLLDRADLGGRGEGPSGQDRVVAKTPVIEGVFGKLTPWPGDGGWIYQTGAVIANGAASAGHLRAFAYGLDTSGQPQITSRAVSSDGFGFGSGSPVVTSNGTSSGSAVVWVVHTNDGGGTGATLRGYDAVPDISGVPRQVFSAPIGTGNKFSMPATDNGQLFVGTRVGHVIGVGADPSAPSGRLAPLDAPTYTFPGTQVGTSSAPHNVVFTAHQAVTVSSVSVGSSAFVAGTPSRALPATLASGDTLTVPVTFSPTATGLVRNTVRLVTSGGDVYDTLSGTGVKAGLSMRPTTVAFGTVLIGKPASQTVTLTNTGSSAATLTSVVKPAAPFSATGLPAQGSQLAGGASVTFTVTYAPTQQVSPSGKVTVTSSDGAGATVTLSGRGTSSPGHLSISPSSLSFGTVDVGKSLTKTLSFTNTGETSIAFTKAKAPAGAFSLVNPIDEGTPLAPHQTRTVTVRFAPKTDGTQSAHYDVTTNDNTGPRVIALTGVGRDRDRVPGPTPTTWRRNGSATLSGSSILLTPATPGRAGSAFFINPVPSAGLSIGFDTSIGGGTGGEGLTLALLDPAHATSASIGAAGAGEGFAGLHGVAVSLDTLRQSTGRPTAGIAVDGGRGTLRYLSARALSSVRGTHHVGVVRYGGRLRVLVDGVAVADAAVSLPRSVLVGFTAGTGSRTDRHVIGHIRAVSGPAARVSVSAGQGAAAPAVVTLTTSASLAGRSALKSASIVFGDGTHWASLSSPTASVAHVYGFAGTYAATAYVADVAGHTSKATVTVHVAAPTGSALPAFTDSGWLRPGSANSAVVDSGSRVTLTPDAPTQQGQVWWHSPVASDGLTATFTSDIAGAGTPWADGMTFGLLDGTADPATAVGSGGGGLGLGGLPGAGVVLDTFDNATGTNVNIVAVATSDSGGLVYLQPVSSAGPSLHNATHRFDVAYRAGRLQLREDGVLVRDVALSLPSTVIVGFTAATGGYQERHSVTDVTIRP